ncbi:MAG: thioredoxin-disulfide reductase [Alphaproteobacteria bacterium]
MDSKHCKVLIIGSGPAGYTAAIYTARENLKPVMIAGYQVGGQLMVTTEVENYPGFAEPIQGPWLMEQMRKQAENVGAEIVEDMVASVDFSERPFKIQTEGGLSYTADTVVISTGAQAKWLGLESEDKFKGFGVSACATCDAFFYRGKDVVVFGGGNTAVEEALHLTNHAAHVTLVHRRDTLRAEEILQKRLLDHPKVTVVWDHVPDEILGDEDPLSVTGVRLKHAKTGETKELKADGVFVAIGHAPSTEIFKGQIDIDAGGYILVAPNSTATSVAGVYAAGDVTDQLYRQAVTAAGTGCMAALEVKKFLD